MIERTYPTVLKAYTGLSEELAYSPAITPLRWGVCLGFPDIITVEIEDIIKDEELHLGMASFTKSRWTRFLRRYFREDFDGWIEEILDKLNRYPSRPFVGSYALNLETGHNYGGCLSSLQIRISPKPQVILYSRACQIDKIGFLDLCLIHLVGKRVQQYFEGARPVRGTWIITNGFISAISQIYYVHRFGLELEGHRMQKTLRRLYDTDYDSIKFGPLMRGRKRLEQLKTDGEIIKGSLISKLTLTKAFE